MHIRPFSGATSAATHPRWSAVRWTARAVQVRLRFLAVIVAAFLVVGKWDVIRTYWDRWTAPATGRTAMGAISENTEYFCPMDPGVLSGFPGKCSVCNMALVRRAKGDMSPLPSGVISRVQFTPEKVLLAGIRTQEVAFRALATAKGVHGTLHEAPDGLDLRCEIDPGETSWFGAGLTAEVRPEKDDGLPPVAGSVRAVEEAKGGPIVVTIAVKAPGALRAGQLASARVFVPIDAREPFRSLPSGKPALRPDEPRNAFVCPDHPDVIRVAAGTCPRDKNALEKIPLEPNQRLVWWCPMHPDVTADRPGKSCEPCGGMELVPRVVTYRPAGQVLTVPESAVIDTGTRKVVFLESMPGIFDGVEVVLGPRSEGHYAVVSGLAPGQRVAASGAFLIDAETRLNPALAAGYFGASRGASPPPAPPTSAPSKLDFSGLSEADRAIALAQKSCPVTGKPLGSMGSPVRVSVRGRVVFLCCDGCSASIRDKPEKYMSKLPPTAKARP